ncbi:MAG: (2Fe-2S) ferredoxin domain-containing protein [Legionellaceae bacterium]|nr:(2Fe-2S) ferredoxin domain-containing protein [Legionellaceae bacterium]MBP9775415.1 (2Fe-2S) ferredoxin domain-containing protein [Legionellaceae bacterium]
MNYYTKHLFICTNQKGPGKQCCAKVDSESFFTYLKTQLKTQQLHGPGKIRVSKSGCLGRCDLGPCIIIYPEGIWYTYTSFADIDEIIQRALINNEVIERLRIKEPPNLSTLDQES